MPALPRREQFRGSINGGESAVRQIEKESCQDGAQQCCAPKWKAERLGWWLGFGEIGVSFHFFNLIGVAFGMGGNEKDELVAIPLGARWAVGGVIAKTLRVHE